MSLRDALLKNDAAAAAETAGKVVQSVEVFKPIPNGSNGFSETVNPPPVVSDPISSPVTPPTDTPDTNAPTAKINAPQAPSVSVGGVLDEVDKQRNLIYCNMVVILAGIGVTYSAQWISGEWDDKNKKEFSFSESNKKQFSQLWADNLNLQGVKKDPNTALGLMAAGMVLPIYLRAFSIFIKKRKAKKEAAKNEGVEKEAPKKEKPKKEIIIKAEKEETPKPEPPKIEQKKEEEVLEDLMKLYPKSEIELIDIDKKGTAQIAKAIPTYDFDAFENTSKKKAGKETRGRKAGAKRNPQGKMEMPVKEDSEFRYYSWGIKVPVKK